MNEHLTKKTLLSTIHTIEGWLSDHEALLLYELARHIPVDGEIVEIGSFKGKSTIALACGIMRSYLPGVVWAIDPHEGIISTKHQHTLGNTYKDFQRNIKNAQVEQQVQSVVETSKQAAKQWHKPIRLLFLDGLHDFNHTREDYRLWSPWVVKNGVIAFHDAFCGEDGVWQVINNYVFKRKDIVDIGTSSSIIYIILGTPNRLTSIRVKRKKKLIRLAVWIHQKRIPWLIKKFGIHVGIRLLLLTKYSAGSLSV